MAKGIDPKFVHYGIRKDDLATIEAICEAESIESSLKIHDTVFEFGRHPNSNIGRNTIHKKIGYDITASTHKDEIILIRIA